MSDFDSMSGDDIVDFLSDREVLEREARRIVRTLTRQIARELVQKAVDEIVGEILAGGFQEGGLVGSNPSIADLALHDGSLRRPNVVYVSDVPVSVRVRRDQPPPAPFRTGDPPRSVDELCDCTGDDTAARLKEWNPDPPGWFCRDCRGFIPRHLIVPSPAPEPDDQDREGHQEKASP